MKLDNSAQAPGPSP